MAEILRGTTAAVLQVFVPAMIWRIYHGAPYLVQPGGKQPKQWGQRRSPRNVSKPTE